eukprot:6165395-Prymnesium_polylepis.1
MFTSCCVRTTRGIIGATAFVPVGSAGTACCSSVPSARMKSAVSSVRRFIALARRPSNPRRASCSESASRMTRSASRCPSSLDVAVRRSSRSAASCSRCSRTRTTRLRSPLR